MLSLRDRNMFSATKQHMESGDWSRSRGCCSVYKWKLRKSWFSVNKTASRDKISATYCSATILGYLPPHLALEAAEHVVWNCGLTQIMLSFLIHYYSSSICMLAPPRKEILTSKAKKKNKGTKRRNDCHRWHRALLNSYCAIQGPDITSLHLSFIHDD
jgi:hypothetical protein